MSFFEDDNSLLRGNSNQHSCKCANESPAAESGLRQRSHVDPITVEPKNPWILETDAEYNLNEKGLIDEIRKAEVTLQKEKNNKICRQALEGLNYCLVGGTTAFFLIAEPLGTAVTIAAAWYVSLKRRT
jgi:hypothetical protein